MKILIVDDFAIMRTVIKNLLCNLGYTDIVQVKDGLEATEIMNDYNFDLIITDWNMPNMNGIDLLKYVRGNDKYQQIPVLIITNGQSKDQIITAAHAGVNGYIAKPFTAFQLKDKLNKITTRLRK